MIDDFMYVLENYPNVDLSNRTDREMVAYALVNIMCEHHVVSYTDLEAARKDPKMEQWVSYCKTKKQETNPDQMELPFERGL